MTRLASILVLHAVPVALFAGCAAEVRSSSAPAPAAATSRPSDKVAADVPAAIAKPVHVDAAGAQQLLATDSAVKILDVRTPGEYAAGHLAGAVNIDFRAADFAERLAGLDRSTRYLVHCRSGGRSTSALATFQKLGFAAVIHLDGGTLAWTKAGLPLEK